jgi:hypothetical protein
MSCAGAEWLEHLQALAPRGPDAARRTSAWFRIADLCLEIVAPGDGFVAEFESRYRDFAIARPRHDEVGLRCEVDRLADGSLLCLSFSGADLPDPLASAGSPLRMLRHLGRYTMADGPADGWRMFIDRAGEGRMLIAGDARRLVIDLGAAPPEFALDCIVGVAQLAQPDLLFLHAASFGIGGAGALLVGGGRAGKSTTALALAARGHRFLGDDVAAVRRPTRELVPFPKAMSLRPGPYVDSFAARLRGTRHASVIGPDGVARTLVHAGDLFPAAAGPALPLRFVFVLDGFAAEPRLTRFRPAIGDTRRLKAAVSESIPDWGLSPGRDLMKFLGIVSLFDGLDCHLLELGGPQASVAAIEHLMMETACNST